MRFAIRPLTDADVDVVATWRYPPPYDVYDVGTEPEELASMRAGAAGAGQYFAVDDAETQELAGFLDLKPSEGEVELGFGMRPDLTGRGLGVSFVEAVMAFSRERWQPTIFTLDVFPWNERAIRAYEKAGFVREEVYVRRFEGGVERTFLRMSRPSVG
jgi:[ribosomal protein S18]-alanine N-acetyltransferase